MPRKAAIKKSKARTAKAKATTAKAKASTAKAKATTAKAKATTAKAKATTAKAKATTAKAKATTAKTKATTAKAKATTAKAKATTAKAKATTAKAKASSVSGTAAPAPPDGVPEAPPHQRAAVATEPTTPGTADSPPVRQQDNGPERLDPEAAASRRFNVVLGESLRNRYKMISVLGHGTFAVTVECWDRELKKCCAVKIVDAEYLRDIEDEIDSMQRVCAADSRDEYALMKIQERFINDQGHGCIVMPKYGPSLRDHLKTHGALRHDARRLAEIIFHCGVALDFLHSETCMIHTDLKPDNILLEEGAATPDAMNMLSGRVRICDFGGCHIASEVRGQIVSTPAYRAPEVMLGLGWLYAADMWSMGCVIYELYTGVPLYAVRSDLEHLHLIEKTLGRSIPAEWPARCSESARALFDATTGRLQSLAVPSRDTVRDAIGTPQLADLVTPLLEYDQTKRLTAREMATHPFVEENFPDASLHPNHPRNRGPFAEVTWPRTTERPAGDETSGPAAAMSGPRPEAASGSPAPPADLGAPSQNPRPADAGEPDERGSLTPKPETRKKHRTEPHAPPVGGGAGNDDIADRVERVKGLVEGAATSLGAAVELARSAGAVPAGAHFNVNCPVSFPFKRHALHARLNLALAARVLPDQPWLQKAAEFAKQAAECEATAGCELEAEAFAPTVTGCTALRADALAALRELERLALSALVEIAKHKLDGPVTPADPSE